MKILLSLALILFAFAVETNACQCAGPGRPCEAYGDAAAIFVGTVTFSSSIKIKDTDFEYTQRLVRLHIDRPIRNVNTSDIEVVTGWGDTDCGFPFRLGGQYLVYANNHQGKLETSICTRTRPLSDAAADLEYIGGLSKAAAGGTIFGEVELRRPSRGEEYPLPPLKDAKIVIKGPDKQFERKTDAEGKFSISGLPPGKYKVRLELSEGLSTYDPEAEVELLDRGCRGTYFEAQPDTRITGRVLDAQGMPAANVLMGLVGVNYAEDKAFPQFVRTDKDGRYELKLLKPARY